MAITAMAAMTHNAITRHGWRTTARPSPPNGPGPAVSVLRMPSAARRTAGSVAYACLLLTMSLPRCVLLKSGPFPSSSACRPGPRRPGYRPAKDVTSGRSAGNHPKVGPGVESSGPLPAPRCRLRPGSPAARIRRPVRRPGRGKGARKGRTNLVRVHGAGGRHDPWTLIGSPAPPSFESLVTALINKLPPGRRWPFGAKEHGEGESGSAWVMEWPDQGRAGGMRQAAQDGTFWRRCGGSRRR